MPSATSSRPAPTARRRDDHDVSLVRAEPFVSRPLRPSGVLTPARASPFQKRHDRFQAPLSCASSRHCSDQSPCKGAAWTGAPARTRKRTQRAPRAAAAAAARRRRREGFHDYELIEYLLAADHPAGRHQAAGQAADRRLRRDRPAARRERRYAEARGLSDRDHRRAQDRRSDRAAPARNADRGAAGAVELGRARRLSPRGDGAPPRPRKCGSCSSTPRTC